MPTKLIKIGGELFHYGVLGMKWGRRRDRGNSAVKRIQREEARKGNESRATPGTTRTASGAIAKTNNKTVQREINRRIGEISDQDLRERVARIQLEQQYLKLTTPPPSPIAQVGQRIIATAGPQLANVAIQSVVNQRVQSGLANKTMTEAQAMQLRQVAAALGGAASAALKK